MQIIFHAIILHSNTFTRCRTLECMLKDTKYGTFHGWRLIFILASLYKSYSESKNANVSNIANIYGVYVCWLSVRGVMVLFNSKYYLVKSRI